MQNRKDMLTRIFLALGFLGFGAMVQAVSPAPDGGYAGFNTAEGTNALFNLTTANDNTALGGQALFHDTTGSRNTAVGLNALFFNVIGSNNTATGAQTLQSNTANGNTANGQLALVAEDIEKVNPDLVVRDKEGKPYSVRYDQVNATLLNEFLKEHRKVEKLEATLAQQQKEMQLLSAHLKEQDLKIQKVSAQVEISRAGPGVVTNDPQNLKSNTSSQ